MEITKIQLPPLPLTLPESSKGKKRLYVLGADDPEMEAIASMLEALGRKYAFATSGGTRVNPASAYKADPVQCEEGTTLTLVECEPREFITGHYYIEYVDHHNEGDIGYNLPPQMYMLGSSLAQVATLEGVTLNEYQLTIAALDHCPAQAMRGLCPGIDPERAKLVYHSETARRKNVSIDEVMRHMRDVGKDIATAPSAMVGGSHVVDMTKNPTGIGYSFRYLSSVAVAMNLGIPLLLSNRNSEGAPEKHVLTGLVTPRLVTDFKGEYAPAHHLSHLWGDDNRGAGGIVTK
jgi:hypothetical protein